MLSLQGKLYFCAMDIFAEKIEKWYAEYKRDLPWRGITDPYLIWVSEIILQQTRVEQGRDYYLRFVERFPDVKSLAEAAEDEVLTYWQGLGYYSRARNMHAAARSMNGIFPATYQEVRALKGVGDYTAAAICSFAYDMPLAVVDGNVYRVLARYAGIDVPIDSTQGVKVFKELANSLLDVRRPALYNQAIMDFGALQCTPTAPHCDNCPLQDSCVAFREGKVLLLPVKQHKTKQTFRYFNYLFIRLGDNYTIINKREKDDIWRNLYQLPLVETKENLGNTPPKEFFRWSEHIGTENVLNLKLVRQGVKHVLSHRIILANFWVMEVKQDKILALPDGFLQVPISHLEDYAFPQLVHKFLQKYL